MQQWIHFSQVSLYNTELESVQHYFWIRLTGAVENSHCLLADATETPCTVCGLTYMWWFKDLVVKVFADSNNTVHVWFLKLYSYLFETQLCLTSICRNIHHHSKQGSSAFTAVTNHQLTIQKNRSLHLHLLMHEAEETLYFKSFSLCTPLFVQLTVSLSK